MFYSGNESNDWAPGASNDVVLGIHMDWGIMLNGNFDVSQFLWVTFILVIIPTAIVYSFIKFIIPNERGAARLPVIGAVSSILVGFLSAFAWLSWSPNSSIKAFFSQGAPNQFPQWQIICCAITLAIGSGVVAYLFGKTLKNSALLALFVSAGFSTAFSVSACFGEDSQQGIGVVLSFIGIFIFSLVINMVTFPLKRDLIP